MAIKERGFGRGARGANWAGPGGTSAVLAQGWGDWFLGRAWLPFQAGNSENKGLVRRGEK